MKRFIFPLLVLAMLAGCADDPSEPYGISHARKAARSSPQSDGSSAPVELQAAKASLLRGTGQY
ncbi:lipoprotein [Noviherbaspirillum massiliense]|uniref:lipoprotein n=1 Tax=Noviherbaspirillum massiliense TaxID=1465823 RepID=UPI000361D7DA